jgi:hypothetical protein
MATLALATLTSAVLLSACGSGSGSSPSSASPGAVSLDVTDAANPNYAHVYVTVAGVAFHTSTNASFGTYSSSRISGWQVTRLATPQTVDLAQLSNGVMYAGTSSGNTPLFSGITLPMGNYQQIRIFLASTEAAYVGSVTGLTYNNEVVLNGSSTEFPLRIPTAGEGIRLIPEAPVAVTGSNNVQLAVDFNLNDDVVQVAPNGNTEFILKPRLGFFNLDSVGAITGQVSFSNLSTSTAPPLDVKAEQVTANSSYRKIYRVTVADKSTGVFNLAPLPIFGNATTASYDILIRGRNVQTTIVSGVRIHSGTTLSSGAVNLGIITVEPGTEFTAQLAQPMRPRGAWVDFYQTISGDPVPYEVRFRHLDPYTGLLGTPENLSLSPIQVASYSPGQALTFAPDSSSVGSYTAVANAAGFYGPGAPMQVTGTSAGQAVLIPNTPANSPQPLTTTSQSSLTTIFDLTLLGTGMGPGMGRGHHGLGILNEGQLFVTYGGMIVDSDGTVSGNATFGTDLTRGGGPNNSFTMSLPGDVSGAVYGLYALGWTSSVLTAGSLTDVDMRYGNAAASVQMR